MKKTLIELIYELEELQEEIESRSNELPIKATNPNHSSSSNHQQLLSNWLGIKTFTEEEKEILSNVWLQKKAIKAKLSACAWVYKEKSESIETLKELIKLYQKRIKRFEREKENLKWLIEQGFNALDESKVVLDNATIYQKESESLQINVPLEELPPEYLKVEVSPDKVKLLKTAKMIKDFSLAQVKKVKSTVVRVN